MKKQTTALLIAILLFSSCVVHNHNELNTQGIEIYGFWYGLWDGFISPFTFIISLFNHNIAVWETHNNGGWYTFGFLWGVGGLFTSGSKSYSKS